MNVLCVLGSRANVIKAKPVVDALEADGHLVELCSIGHDPRGDLPDTCRQLGFRPPDVHLAVGPGSDAVRLAKAIIAFERHLEAAHPDWILVIDHVSVALASALVGAKAGVRVAHLEAGLRCHDWSHDGEIHRVTTDRLSDVLLVPSPSGVNNLRVEGYDEWQIQLVGNTAIDTLRAVEDHLDDDAVLAARGLQSDGYVAVIGSGRLAGDADLADAVAKIGQQLPVAVIVDDDPGDDEPAPSWLDRLVLERNARLVITDLGEVQDETTALGVPCLTVGTSTDRPVTIVDGTNHLVPAEAGAVIEAAVELLAGDQPGLRCPALWDGNSGRRVAEALTRADIHGGRRRGDQALNLR